MHGILFKQLKTYVESEWGEDAWTDAMDAADIEPKLYLPVTDYPDEEAERLVDGIVEVTGVRENDLLADLGEHMAPALLDTFKAHIKEDWDLMDLVEQADHQVYAVLHAEDGDSVSTEREDEDSVRLEYDADLEMCALARGVLVGLADEHGVDVDVSENACMEHGADACEMRVRRA